MPVALLNVINPISLPLPSAVAAPARFASNNATDTFVPSKKVRLQAVFKKLSKLPCAKTSLEAYRQLSELIKSTEDESTPYPWQPPQGKTESTKRLYATQPLNIYTNNTFYKGVSILLSKGHLVFIGRNGAIEVQTKAKNYKTDPTPYGDRPFHQRPDAQVIFKKAGANGLHVWEDDGNR